MKSEPYGIGMFQDTGSADSYLYEVHYNWLQELCKNHVIAWWLIAIPIQFILPLHRVRLYFTF